MLGASIAFDVQGDTEAGRLHIAFGRRGSATAAPDGRQRHSHILLAVSVVL